MEEIKEIQKLYKMRAAVEIERQRARSRRLNILIDDAEKQRLYIKYIKGNLSTSHIQNFEK